jgi:phospholipase C
MRGVLAAFLVVSAAASPPRGSLASPPRGTSPRIKHIVVLMEENRSFDHLFGWYKNKQPGGRAVDGLTGAESNPLNGSDASSPRVRVDDASPYIGRCDPAHGTGATAAKVFGAAATAGGTILSNLSGADATMSGFVAWEARHNAAKAKAEDYCGVMSGFAEARLPVASALADSYVLMDRFFCSHPGPTWPNRLFALTGTSAGSTETGVWHRDHPGALFPQKTFFEQLAERGLPWRNYYRDTPWELFLRGVATAPASLRPLEQFFADAAAGALPAFAWINPRSGIDVATGEGSDDQHPDHDVALGEKLIKDVYEALRAGPAWNETLLIVTYDEHGGFFDHVPPPGGPGAGVPPPGDGESSYPDGGYGFDRLGVRVPTLLVSPWVARGGLVGAPPPAQKPSPTSEYDLTSIMASARKLLSEGRGEDEGEGGGEGEGGAALPLLPWPALTDRDAWSATFEHALLDAPRADADCPRTLPAAPPPAQISSSSSSSSSGGGGGEEEEEPVVAVAREAALPLNHLQHDILAMVSRHSERSPRGRPAPRHPRTQGEVGAFLAAQLPGVLGAAAGGGAGAAAAAAAAAAARADGGWALRVAPSAGTKWAASGWAVNGSSTAVPDGGLATLVARFGRGEEEAEATLLCLSAAPRAVANGSLSVQPCLAAAAAATHVPGDAAAAVAAAAAQQWLLRADATLSPGVDASLCVAAVEDAATGVPSRVRLQPCDGRVEQHWAFHGTAPGNPGGGMLYYGDDLNTLGVVAVV